MVGFPAVSIPAPIVAAELPIGGVQLVAPPGRDGVLLAVNSSGRAKLATNEPAAAPCPGNLTLLMETSGERLG